MDWERVFNVMSEKVFAKLHFLPSRDNKLDLGSAAARWYDIFVGHQLKSDVATGTAPFVVASTTVVANLNADSVDGLPGHAAVTLGADAGAVLGLTGQEVTLDTQAANTVFAGPTSGADAAPTVRPLVAADMPAGIRFIPLTTAATSASWDGDAKDTGDRAIIDLSAVFGLPAGIAAIAVLLAVKDDIVGAEVALGPAGTSSATRNAVVATVQVANQYVHCAGIVPCDANGDIYCYPSGSIDAVYLRIWGYWL